MWIFERWFERKFERISRAPLKSGERWVERRSRPQIERWVEWRSDFENERWIEHRSLFGKRTKDLQPLQPFWPRACNATRSLELVCCCCWCFCWIFCYPVAYWLEMVTWLSRDLFWLVCTSFYETMKMYYLNIMYFKFCLLIC